MKLNIFSAKNKTGLKDNFIFLPALLILLLHSPFVFAMNKSRNEAIAKSMVISNYPAKDSVPIDNNIKLALKTSAYDSMKLQQMGLPLQTFNYAMDGFNYLVQQGKLANVNIISIVDFSLPSSAKRFFVIDLKRNTVLYCTYVAHAVNSGKEYANLFSNRPQSNKSSLGFYVTQNTYQGGHGYSLKLEGLEKGINDNANRRAIVIHGADYVDEALIKTQGYIGRSLGCPALPVRLYKPIINKIKNGTCLFIYNPDKAYLERSSILNVAGTIQ